MHLETGIRTAPPAPQKGEASTAPLIDIVIVSYNCRPYLYQTLVAVRQAVAHLQAATGREAPVAAVWVVDNASPDGAPEMVRAQFPEVKLIASEANLGFSKANNLAIREGKAPWVLLLNPDTILAPDTLEQALAFADSHPDAGGLGLKQINAEGRFMPESKRGNPTPWVAFYKLVGLSALFPKSRKFGAYYQRHLHEDEPGPVPILSGAAMMLRRTTLDKIGLLDERFFLYGEDIDLSYRVILGGEQNYYVPEARLLHYKGRSTPKTNLRYLWVFYEAMWLFAQKHLSGTKKIAWRIPVALAIGVRGLTAFAARLVSLLALPIGEGVLAMALSVAITLSWGAAVAYGPGAGNYPAYIWQLVAPGLSLLYVVGMGLTGAYHRPFQIRPVVAGVAGGFGAIVLLSYLVPQWNFSRASVVLTAGAVFLAALLIRLLLSRRQRLSEAGRPTVLAGRREALARFLELLSNRPEAAPAIERILSPDTPLDDWTHCWTQQPLTHTALTKAVAQNPGHELVLVNPFAQGLDIPALVVALKGTHTVRLQPDGSSYLIGPEYWHDNELAAVLSVYEARQWRFRKRVLAFGASTALLLSYPLLFGAYQKPGAALKGLWDVWRGRQSLVGYQRGPTADLPALKPGLLTTEAITALGSGASAKAVNRYYAARAALRLDLQVLRRRWRSIGAN